VFESINGTNRVTIKNSEIGPACCGNATDGVTTVGSPVGIRFGSDMSALGNFPPSTDIVIHNNLIHGITRNCAEWLSGYGSCPQSTCLNTGDLCHADAIQIWGSENTTITNNRMYHNEVQAIFIDQTWPNVGGTISNNMIGEVSNGIAGIALNGANGLGGTWNIINNTLATGEVINFVNSLSSPPGTMVNVKGNIGNWYMPGVDPDGPGPLTANDCNGNNPSVVTLSYNTWGGQSSTPTGCGGNETVGVPSFVSVALAPANTMDLHLAGANGNADNKIPSCFISTDIDENARPLNTNCDAGADERNQ
jgi:hypothetical protein